jgi:hypothetical protein
MGRILDRPVQKRPKGQQPPHSVVQVINVEVQEGAVPSCTMGLTAE